MKRVKKGLYGAAQMISFIYQGTNLMYFKYKFVIQYNLYNTSLIYQCPQFNDNAKFIFEEK